MTVKRVPVKKIQTAPKVVAVATAFFILTAQTLPVSLFAAPAELPPMLAQEHSAPATNPDEVKLPATEPQAVPVEETSLDYLQHDFLLTRVPTTPSHSVPQALQVLDDSPHAQALAAVQQDYTFSGALDFLKKQTSKLAAAVVQNITKENLLAVARLPYEVGLAVIDGVVMMFTSYQADNLDATSALKNVLDGFRTSFLMHFQPHEPEPSYADRQGARDRGDRIEHTASLKDDGTDLDVYEYRSDEASVRVIESDEFLARIESQRNKEVSNEQLHVLAQELTKAIDGSAERYRSEPPTVFSGEPTLATFASASPAATVNIVQTSSSIFRINYNVSNSGSYAGGIINFVPASNVSSLSKFTFEMLTNNTCGTTRNCLKLEVVDAANRKASVYIRGLNAVYQQVDIQFATLRISRPDLDFTQIKQINFVEDSTLANPKNGYLEVKTGGLAFTPTISGTAYTQSALTSLPGSPVVGSGKGDANNNSTVTTSQTSAQDFSMAYTLTDADDFGFTALNFGAAQNLSSGIVLAATVASGKKVKVEVKDINNKIADFWLSGTGAKLNYALTLSGADNVPQGYDATSIKQITLVVDKANAGAAGTLTVETKGLDYTPSISGTAYTQSALTSLPGSPVVGSGKGDANGNSTVTTSQTSAQDFSMTYSLTDAVDFGFTTLSFSPTQIFSSGIVLAATVANGKKIKVEVKDVNGKIADYYLIGTGAKLNYTLSLTGTDVPSGFDKTQISLMTFVADQLNTGASGTLTVETKGLDYTPTLTGTTYTQSAITSLPGYPVMGSGKSDANENSAVTLSQTSAQDFSMTYSLTDAVDFGFTTLSFPTGQNLAGGLVLAANIPLGKKIKVEVKDVSGKMADYYLSGTGAKLNYTLSLTGTDVPSGFNSARIALIAFVADVALSGNSGTIAIETKGMDYAPALTGTAYTQSAITNLPAYPVLGSGKGDADGNSSVTVSQISARDFTMDYALTDDEDFAFSAVSFPSVQNLSNGIVLAANIASGKKIKVEVKDKTGKIADYYLAGTGAKMNYTHSLSGTDVPAGFDKAKISMLTFVVDMASSGNSGSIAIETQGLNYTPALTGTTYTQGAITNLPAYPVLGSGTGDTDGNSTVAINQTSARDFTMNYTLVDDEDFAFSTVSFAAVQNLSSGIVLAANIPSGRKIKVEVKDAGGKIADYYLTGTGAKLNYTLSLTGEDVPAGFDKTKILMLVFVADVVHAGNSGSVAIETKGMNYTPALTGTVYTVSALTNLPNYPVLTAGKNDPDDNSTVAINQTNSKYFLLNYELTDATDFAFAALSFPSAQNLSSGIVLASTVTSGKRIKVEVKDLAGKIADYYLIGTGIAQNYTLSLTGEDVPAGFDSTQILSITFVADVANSGNSDVFSIVTSGMKISPSITGTTYTQSAITNLPGYPVLGTGINDMNDNSSVTAAQTSARDFTLAYTLTDSIDFAFSTLSLATPQNLSSGIVLAANLASGKKIKVEVKDANGKIASYYLVGGGSKQNYALTLVGDGTPTGFDNTRITQITFVVDVTNAGSSGSIAIETKGMNYTPALTGTAYTQSAITNLPGYPILASGKNDPDDNSTVGVDQTSSKYFSMTYALTDPEDFAFASLSFPSVQNLPSGIVLAANIAGGKKIKVEVKDAAGKIADYYLIGTGVKQNYTLSLTGEDVPTGFNKAQISLVTLVADTANAGTEGVISVETNGIKIAPSITGTTYTQSAITNLPGYPALGSGINDMDDNSFVTLSQTSARDFTMAYTLTDSVDFSFSTLSLPTPANFSTGIVLAANIVSGKKIKVEVKDAGGKVAAYYLVGSGSKKNYTLTLAGDGTITGFDNTRISQITFVADVTNAGSSGSVAIETRGMNYTPALTGTVYTQSALTNLPGYPVLASGKNDPDDNSTVSVNQTSSKDFSMTYALTDPEDFAFSTLSFTSTQNLSSGIVLAANIANGKKIKVEVKDAAGKIADYYLTGTGAKLNYTLSLTGEDVPTGFDKTRIVLMTFVAETLNAGSSGTFAVETKGLSYSPVITGQAYNAAAITNLPDYPVLSAGKNDSNDNADVSVDQTSSSAFVLNYNLTDPEDFGFARIAFTTPKPLTQVVFAANLASGQKMKVEVKDANGKKVSFWLAGGGSLLNYTLDLTGEHVPAGFLTDFISEIVFVADPVSMGTSGSISLETGGLEYTPVITV